MNKDEFLQYYTDVCVATCYIVGFVFKKQVYMVKSDRLSPDYMVLDRSSSANGGSASLRIRFETGAKMHAIMDGAECIGSADMLKDDKYNQGDMFEKKVTELYGQEWKKDHIPFWQDGDINVNGEKIQVKFDRATLATSKEMEKIAKRAAVA